MTTRKLPGSDAASHGTGDADLTIPVSVTWHPGDGSTVTCHGAGTPYTSADNPAAASPDCGQRIDHLERPGYRGTIVSSSRTRR